MFRLPKKLMLTYIIIAMNVAVYVLTSVWGGDFMVTGDLPLEFLGQVNYHVILDGWYWQLFTSMFVHADIVHLFGNMFFLLIFGLRAEEMFDAKEYLLIYFASGLAGSLLTLLMGLYMISVGASGAIFGVFGAVIIYIRRAGGQSIIGALLFAFLFLLLNAGYGVNVLAHLGGLVAGLVIGYLLATTRRKTTASYTYRISYTT